MVTKLTRRCFRRFLLISCLFVLVSSVAAKDRNRTFSGKILQQPNARGVQGVVVHLRPLDDNSDQKKPASASGTEVAAAVAPDCPPPETCETTGHGGNFSFHHIDTGVYELSVYKDTRVIYTHPGPVLIPQMPTNSNLTVSLPRDEQK